MNNDAVPLWSDASERVRSNDAQSAEEFSGVRIEHLFQFAPSNQGNARELW